MNNVVTVDSFERVDEAGAEELCLLLREAPLAGQMVS